MRPLGNENLDVDPFGLVVHDPPVVGPDDHRIGLPRCGDELGQPGIVELRQAAEPADRMSPRPVSISERSEREALVASATLASESPRAFRMRRRAAPSSASWPGLSSGRCSLSLRFTIVRCPAGTVARSKLLDDFL